LSFLFGFFDLPTNFEDGLLDIIGSRSGEIALPQNLGSLSHLAAANFQSFLFSILSLIIVASFSIFIQVFNRYRASALQEVS
jgi:hypothetical protein